MKPIQLHPASALAGAGIVVLALVVSSQIGVPKPVIGLTPEQAMILRHQSLIDLPDGQGGTVKADDAASTLDAFKPDIALWDLGWSPSTAFERLAEYIEAEVSVVALVSNEEHASRARASGALGVLARDVAAASLQAALAAVAQGMLVLDPELTPPVPHAPPGDAVEALTRRELEVLRLLAEGSSNKAIAYGLDISEHTVKFHVNSIFAKLHAQSRTEAVAIATRLGLILL